MRSRVLFALCFISVLIGQQDDWYVATTGSDGGAGTLESPFATIQTGINAASSGNTVHVAAGTYIENISYSNKSISIIGADRETTIIDGDSSGAVLIFDGDDSYTIHLSGFTITNGSNNSNGGGVYIEDGLNIDLSNLIIANNVGSQGGSSNAGGGGMYIESSTGNLSNLIFSGNSAYAGGGLYALSSELILDGCDFRDNNGDNNGGGIRFKNSDADIYNSAITNNHAHFNGAGIYFHDGEFNITNVTIAYNTTHTNTHINGRGGAFEMNTANVTVSNSIIWDNYAISQVKFAGSNPSTLNINYSNFYGGQDQIVWLIEQGGGYLTADGVLIWGDGMVDSDPLFVDSESDYHLRPASPCIDTANPDSTDGDGTRADMGAYYYDQIANPIPYGCTDPYADNYDADAIWDDGSCYGEYSISFDGVDDYVDVAYPISSGASDVTYSIWFKLNNLNSQYILGSQSELDDLFELYYNGGTGNLQFIIRDGSYTSIEGGTVSAGSWYHAAMVRDYDDSLRLFLNGNQIASGATPQGSLNPSIRIGNESGSSQWLNGSVDEFSIWSEALSKDQILSSGMFNELTGSEPGLVGYWDFNEVIDDTVLADKSINTNDGVIHGATTRVSDPFVTVFFNSDLTDQVVSNNGVHIAGTFNDWNTESGQMTDADGNGIYSYAAAFSPGDTVEYKFINGNSWGYTDGNGDYISFTESVTDPTCGEQSSGYGNRRLIVPDQSVIIGPFCLNSCVSCDDAQDQQGGSGGNYSMVFDGSDDYIEVPHHSSLNINETGDSYRGTVMAWVNLSYPVLSDNDWPRIVSKKTFWSNDNGYELQINPYNYEITLLGGGDDAANGTLLHQDGWAHIAATFDNWGARIYFNGIDVTWDGNIGRIQSSDDPLWIGSFSGNSEPGSGCCWMDGFIDDVALYNVELTQEQIQEIMNNGVTSNQTLAAYWDFNEGSGSGVLDGSINSNNGTVHGAGWSESVFTKDSDGVLYVPSEYSTIQEAINYAVDGQIVQVAAGTYTENLNFNGKNISVIGESQETTTIDGDSSGVVVMFRNNEKRSAVLQNFTITNGYAVNGNWPFSDDGAGIYINHSSPTLRNLSVVENYASDWGGGIALTNSSSPLLENMSINENSSGQHGGGLAIWDNSSAEVRNANISNNTANGNGGGVLIDYSNPTFENVQITGNSSGSMGGGVRVEGNSYPIMNNMVVSNNSADQGGGGIYFGNNNNTTLTMGSSTISNNSAKYGGGIGVMGNTINISNSTISGNTTSVSGGTNGGGVYAVGGSVNMEHVDVSDNTAASTGGGLYLQTVMGSLDRVTVVSNTANDNGGALKVCCGGTIDIENSIFFSNSPGIQFSGNGGNIINVSYSNMEGGQGAVVMPGGDSLYWGPGNIDLDPLFVDAAAGDYGLQSGSPSIDTGNPDSDGDSVEWGTDYDDRDPDMTRLDMGAYFYNQDESAIPDYALSFDGQDDYARINSDLYADLTQATFSWYVKTGMSSTNLVLLGLDTWANDAVRGFFLFYTEEALGIQLGTTTQEKSFHIYNGGKNNEDIGKNISYDLETDTYYNIVAVFRGDEETVSIYIDGQFIGSVHHENWDYIAEANPHYAEIGANRRSNLFTEQKLSDLRIWNRAITPWEIQAHLDLTYEIDTDGLIGHWDFDEGQGSASSDAAGANHISLHNGIDWTLDTPQQGSLPEFFNPVEPTGIPYHVVVSDLQINNGPVNLGAEVGLFDGNICVGAAVYDNTRPGTFTGKYYMPPSSGGVFSNDFGALVLTREDSSIHFDNTDDFPSQIANQPFQAKWTGDIYAPITKDYQFYQLSAGGMRLYVDGARIINRWNSGNNYEYATVTLSQGFHSVEVHFASHNHTWNYLRWDMTGSMSETIPVDPTPSISVSAWEKNIGPPALVGFTSGNAITAKVRSQVYGIWQQLDPTTQVVLGDGNFGTGSYSVIALDASTAEYPVASLSATSVDFGASILNSTTSRSVTLSNTGSAPLTVTLVKTSDPQYSIEGDLGALIGAGSSKSFVVNYIPTQDSPANAVLQFYSDAPQGRVVSVNLIGQGLPIPVPIISLPDNIDFSSVATGRSHDVPLSIFNTGSAELTVSGLSANGDGFSIADTASFSVAPGNEASISLFFSPEGSGSFFGQVVIASDAINQPSATVNLVGLGYEDYFNSVAPTGLPYTIIVDSITVDEAPLSVGDQVAVFEFDEGSFSDKAVGTAVYTGSGGGASSSSSLSLDQNQSYVEVSDASSLDFSSSLSVEFWAKPLDSQNGYATYVSKMNGWSNGAWAVHSSGNGERIRWEINTTNGSYSFDTPTIVADGEWHHIACTWDGNTMKAYIDGDLDAYTSTNGTLINTSHPVRIGRRQDGQNSLKGLIDEVRIWNRAISQSEIQEKMNKAVNSAQETGLVAYWRFDDGGGTFALDLSGFGNNGTIHSSSWSSLSPNLSYPGSAMQITSWASDPESGLDGFTQGAAMSFKIYASVYDSMMQLSPEVTWKVGDQNFGTGQFSVIELHAISGVDPVIRVDQTNLVFPPAVIGQTLVDTLYIYNDGLSELSISSISSQSGRFSVEQGSFSVQPESFFAVAVSFSPLDPLPYSDVLTITSDDPESPINNVTVQGQGLPATYGVLSLPDGAVQFPATANGDTSVITVPLFNGGTQALVVDSVVFGDNVFFTPSDNIVIGIGETHNIHLSFSPDSIGGYESNMIIYTNSHVSPSVFRGVFGTGFEGFFHVVKPTGLPYTVIVDSLVGPADSIQAGDEIGIFDGSTPVGVVVVDKNFISSKNNQYSLSFDGVDDYVRIDEPLLFDLADFTFSAWVNINSSHDGWNTILDIDNDEQQLAIVSNTVGIYGRCGYVLGGTVNPGWQHVAWSVSGSNYSLYVNGTKVSSGSGCSNSVDADRLMIGAGYGDQAEVFQGEIDEVQVWNRSLTQSELVSKMGKSPTGQENGLIGYWSFHDGTGSTASDLTYNGNDGVVSGALWSSSIPYSYTLLSLSGIAWEADTDKGQAGFTPGNPFSFRYFARRSGVATVYQGSHVAVQGDGNFGTGSYSVVQVSSTAESIFPSRMSTMSDRTVVEDSGPNNFTVGFNSYFIHPYDPLEFVPISIDSSAVIGVASSSTILTVTPQQDWFGTTDLIIGATDGYFFSYDTITITGLPINDHPVVSGIPDSTINEDESFVFDLDQYTIDVDNDSSEITYSAQVVSGDSENALFSINDSTHTMSVSAVPDSSGSFSILVTAVDDSSAVGSDTFHVDVVPVNDAPTIVFPILDKQVYRSTGLHTLVNNLNSVFIDKEGDILDFEIITDSDSITTVIQNNRLSVNLLADHGGVEEIIVTCTDGELTTADTFNLSFVKWAVRIAATSDDATNADNFIGVAGPATDGYDPEYERPVGVEEESLSVYFSQPEGNFDQDIRPIIALSDTSHPWEFNVVSPVVRDVSLGFQFLDYPSIPARIFDVETGESQQLTQSTELQFTTSAGSPRAFQIKVGDVVPPSPVQDLAVDSSLSRSMVLKWTAPGDDGASGLAVSYDIRYSYTPINTENFSSAIGAGENTPLPVSGGGGQTMAISGLEPATEYYFALRTIDDAGNISSLSNFLSSSTLPVPLTDLESYWGKFHNSYSNSGYSDQGGASLDSLLWSFETGGWVNSSPTVDDRGDIYFGSEDGSVYAVNLDGSLKWSYDTGGGVVTAPLVSTMDRLYVGSKSNVFYCFNRTNGDTIWTYTADDQIYSSAVIDSSGRLFFGDLGGTMYCLDSEFGTAYWEKAAGNRIYSSPALSPNGNSVYIGGFDKKVYSLDGETGDILWNYETGGYILSSLAVDDEGVVYASSSDKKLYAINPDGTEKWSYTTGGAIWYSSPALGVNNDIYIGSDDNKLYSINRPDGTLRWDFATGGDVRNSPAVAANGGVYFGSGDNTLYHLDTSGTLQSSAIFGDQIQTSSAAIGAGGNIYIGSYDQKLYAYGMGDTIPPAAPTGLEVTSGDLVVGLSWAANEEPDLSSYIIYRSTSESFDPGSADSLDLVWKNLTSYKDTTVANGLAYYYRLKAADVSGNRSTASDAVAGLPTDLPPSSPSQVDAIAGDGLIILSWAAGDEYDLEGHIIYRSTDSTFVPSSGDSIATVLLPTVSYVDSGLTTGVSYYYRLSAYDSGGNVGTAGDRALGIPQDLTAPIPPEGFVVDNGDEEVTLTWAPNSEGDLEGYQIYNNTDSTFIPSYADLLTTVQAPDTAYTDTGLVNSFTYYYRVTALDTTGNESPVGDLVIGTPTDKTPPAAPSDLVSISGDHVVDLSWSPNIESDMAYYVIYRNTDSTFVPGPDDFLSQVGKLSTAYKDTTVNNGSIYFYRIAAGDIGNNVGLPSSVAIGAPVDLPPSPPADLVATDGDGRISLNWSSGDEYDLIGHIIYRSNDSTFIPSAEDSIATAMYPAFSYIDSGLTTGLPYYYYLRSFDQGGNISPESKRVFGVPVDLTAPLTPSGLVVLDGERELTITWEPNGEGDLSHYKIYRGSDSLFVPDSSNQLVTVLAPEVFYTDLGLMNGSTYYYRLTSTDTTGNESATTELVSGTPTDLTPPSSIVDLEVVNFASNFIDLAWTSTGGDSTDGRATVYDLRVFDQEITEDNFYQADTVSVSVPVPASSGNREEISITGLTPETFYYFAIKAADSTGNISQISNVVFQETSETPKLLTSSLWAKFHEDNQNSGLSSINGTETGSVVWTFETGADINSSPVLDDRGDVYFGSDDGRVYALNVDGTLKWSHPTGNGVVATPLVATMDRLYIGSKSGKFYCFNRTTGSVIWQYTAGNEIHSSAAIDEQGRIFFGDNDGNLTCLDSEFGSVYWQASVGNRIYASPALSPDGTTVYVGGFDKKVYALDVVTGEVLWSFTTNGYLLGSLLVDEDGMIYAGSSGRKLYAINPDGTQKWRYSTSGGIWYSSPTLGADGEIFIGSDDRKVHSVNRSNGSPRWKFTTAAAIRNSPAVSANGNIYFGSSDDNIYGIDQSGNLIWNYTTNGEIQSSSPAIGPNGNIYIGSYDNSLYLIGVLDTIAPSIPSNFSGIPGDERATLVWDISPENDLSRYRIYKGSSASSLVPYDSVSYSHNTFADSIVENNMEYFYTMKAIDQLGNNSLFTDTISIVPYDQTPPPVPQGLTAEAGDSEIDLNWRTVIASDFLRYRLYLMNDDSSFSAIDSTGSTVDTSINISSLENKQTYRFAVTAVDTLLNESAYSTIVNSTPYDGPVWYVSSEGDNNDIGYITDPFETIQYAVNYAEDGDTVMVLPGTYLENININEKSIVLRGLGNPDSIVVDGNQAGSVVTITGIIFNSVFVENMTITNGSAENGGGISAVDVSLGMKQLIVSENVATASGGGIYILGAQSELTNLVISENSSANGGGLYADGNAFISLWNSTVSDNISSSEGDGLLVSEGTIMEIINSVINGNGDEEIVVGQSEEPGILEISYSSINGGQEGIVANNGEITWAGNNILDGGGVFVSRGGSDYSLSDFSHLIGGGTGEVYLDVDLYGNLRPNPAGTQPDIGAIESIYANRRPKSRVVYDGLSSDADWFSDSTIVTHWQSFIDDGVVSYEVAIGIQQDTLDGIMNWVSVENDTSYTAQLSGINSGIEYFVSVRGLDSDNQMSDTTTSDGFQFDFVPPMIDTIMEIQADVDMDYLGDSTDVEFFWSGSDNASGLLYFQYALALEGSIVLDWISTGLDTFAIISSFPFVEGKVYNLLVRAVDVAGNISESFSGDGFLIDYTSPEIGIVFDGSVEDISYMGSDSSYSGYWSNFYDDVSGIDYFEVALGSSLESTDIVDWTSTMLDTFINLSGLMLQNGQTCFLSIRAVDVAGNVSNIVSSNGVTVDIAHPSPGAVYDGVTVDLDWSNKDSTLSAIWTTFSDSLSGTQQYSISIGTTMGDDDVSMWEVVGSDTSAFVNRLTLDEGVTYFFNVVATDSVGNVGQPVSSDGITIDLTSPNTALNLSYYYYGPDRWGDTPDPLSGSASDELSGVESVEIMVNRAEDGYFFSGSGWTPDSSWIVAQGDTLWAYNNRMVSLNDGGLYRLFARATDRAGNKDLLLGVDSLIYDSSPPLSSVDIDLEFYNLESWETDSSISGVASDSVSSVDSVWIALEWLDDNQWFDGNGWSPFENWHSAQGLGSWSFSFPAASLNDSSSYRVHCRAFDAAGNQQQTSSTDIFVYDISLPETGLVFDGDEAGSDIDWTNEDEAVNAVWSGFNDIISGIIEFEYKITDQESNILTPWTSVGQDTFFVDSSLSLLTGTQYFVSVRATDGADNISLETSSDGVVVDTIAPVIIYVYEGSAGSDQDFQYESDSVMVSWGGGDTREIAHYEVSLGSEPGQADIVDWLDVGTASSHEFISLDLISSQTCYGNVRARDKAGNISGLLSGDGLTIDQDGPISGDVADFNIEDVDWIGIDYQIQAYATGFKDTLSGVVEYFYSIGLAAGQENVLAWTSFGPDSTFLYPTSLTVGPTYYVNAKAVDALGNVSAVVTSDGFGVDLSEPIAGSIVDGLETDLSWTKNDSSLSANWSGFEDATSGIASYQYSIGSSPGGQNVTTWTQISGSLFTITKDSLSLNHGSTYYFNIRALDQAENISNISSSNGITLDIESPNIQFIMEESLSSPPYQPSDNSMALYCGASDNLSGIDHYQYALGSTLGDSDVVVWTSFSSENSDVLFEGLFLNNGAQFFGQVRVFDQAGNFSQQSGNGIIVDATPPEVGAVFDILDVSLLEDQSMTNSITTLSAYISGFSDSLSGVDRFEYAVGTSALFSDVKDWTTVSQDTFMIDDGLLLEHAQIYFVSARAYDGVGNISPSVSSDGITVDAFMGPPVVVGLSIQANSWISPSHNTIIDLDFSEPVKNYDVNITTSIPSQYSIASAYISGSDSTQMQITLVAPFAALDTVTFGMLGLTDLVDNVAETDTFFKYPTHMVGDYNADNFVDILDLNQFVVAWDNKDYLFETGPVSGEIPYFIPQVNNNFDLRDVMAFTRMWHYSKQLPGSRILAARYEQLGQDANIYQDGQYLVFQGTGDVNAAKVILSYPETSKKVHAPEERTTEGVIRLSHQEEGYGITTETAFITDSLDKSIRFKIESLDRDNALFDVDYIALDKNSSVVFSGRKTIDVIAVPDNYALHPNYPNPFNPLTRINYDIPKDGPVELIVFDILGREVVKLMNQNLKAGYHSMIWRGLNKNQQNVGAGVYFFQLRSENYTKTIKMLLLK